MHVSRAGLVVTQENDSSGSISACYAFSLLEEGSLFLREVTHIVN
jgi:hypothetical protein